MLEPPILFMVAPGCANVVGNFFPVPLIWVHCSGSVVNTGVSPDLKLQLSQEVFGSF